MGDEIRMIVCLINSSPCLRHYCDNMQAVLELHKVLKRGMGMGMGKGGWGSQENKRNSGGKNYREDIFAAVYLRKPSGREKQFPTISKLIKRLQFISV